MAKIVLGIGTSHSPILALPGEAWHHRAQADINNPALSLSDGRRLTYQELAVETKEPYGACATEENYIAASQRCQMLLDRLAAEIERAAPDVVVIVGDDQSELYTAGNIPAIALFWGAEVVTHSYGNTRPDWFRPVAVGYGMDVTHRYPGHPDLARAIIANLIDQDVDLAILRDVLHPDTAGFGHAFGFPVERLFNDRKIPIVPVILNTYYPPNVLSAARCYDIGHKLRHAIESYPADLRVAIIASGGLSHFVVDESLDRSVLDNLSITGAEVLRALPREALQEGSSEILNWVLTAGAVSCLPLKWVEYEPVRRTPAGTGIGCAFAAWAE